MAFPINPNPGDTYTDAYGTVWVYAGSVNGWYRQTVYPVNDTTYIGSDGAPGGAGGNTQVVFNDNGSLAGDSGLTYNKTTDALSSGAFVPTGSTVPTNGVYRPSANNVAISTNGTGRLFIDASGKVFVNSTTSSRLEITNSLGTSGGGENLHSYTAGFYIWGVRNESNNLTLESNFAGNIVFKALSSGASSSPGTATERLRITSTGELQFKGAGTNGSPGSPAVSFNGSAPSNSLVIDSSGRVGLGTSSPQSLLHVNAGTDGGGAIFGNTSYNYSTISQIRSSADALFGGGVIASATSSQVTKTVADAANFIRMQISDGIAFHTNITGASGSSVSRTTNERMRIDSSGRVGIGTTSPLNVLDVKTTSDKHIIFTPSAAYAGNAIYASTDAGSQTALGIAGNPLQFFVDSTGEAARIDSSKRLLVGTSTSPSAGSGQFSLAVIQGYVGAPQLDGSLSIQRGEGAATITSGEELGGIYFNDNAGNTFANIKVSADANAGAGDYPGRLVFSVTADGSASPTEALRISSNRAITVSDGGNVVLGTTTGTKIGTATTQKLGFYNATPVVQPAAVADATDAATVITQLNDLLAKLRTLGLIAT